MEASTWPEVISAVTELSLCYILESVEELFYIAMLGPHSRPVKSIPRDGWFEKISR